MSNLAPDRRALSDVFKDPRTLRAFEDLFDRVDLASGATYITINAGNIYSGVGVPTFVAPNGSLYIRTDVSQLWRYSEAATVTVSAVNVLGTNLKSGTNSVTLNGFDAGKAVRISKPLAAHSGGLLTWDAYSPWPDDSGTVPVPSPVPGQTWNNTFSVYGHNGGADVLLFTTALSPNNYATAAAAYAALAAQLPASVTGYSTYKVVGVIDPNPADNRGGLSVLVQELTPGWVLMSDLTEIRDHGTVIESAPRSLDFEGAVVVGSDGAGHVTVTVGALSSANVSGNFTTTAANSVYFLDTSGGAYTVTLNATPAVNELVEVWDATGHAGTNPISFDGNGKTIAGSATVASFIHIDFGHARLIFNGTQWLIA